MLAMAMAEVMVKEGVLPGAGQPLPPHEMHPDLKRTSGEARAAGQQLFFTELPCIRSREGHLSPRKVSNGACLACLEGDRRKKDDAEAAKRAKARALRDAPKLAARRAIVKAAQDAKEAREAQRRADREARAKQRATAKAAVTRAANKAAKEAAARPAAGEAERVPVVPWASGDDDDERAPWDDSDD